MQHRPVRLQGIEMGDGSSGTSTRAPSLDTFNLPLEEPILAEVLAEHLDENPNIDTDIDPTVLAVDRNHEYSVWLSYAEVYNEKIYDLLADVEDANAGSSQSQRPVLLTRKALPIKPSPPSDGWDGPSGTSAGKYVSGLKHIRVDSAADAKNLVRLGQLHRRVFGTLANSQSSRSHGMVTIKLLRKHRGEPDVSYILIDSLPLLHSNSFLSHRSRLPSTHAASPSSTSLVQNARNTHKRPVIVSRKQATSTNRSWS